MDNRFGIKDLVFIVLIVTTAVLVVLGWTQRDRQWDRLDTALDMMERQQQAMGEYEQTVRALRSENTALRGGVEQMTTQVGEFTQAVNAMTEQVGEVRDGVNKLVTVLEESAKQGNAGPSLGGESIGLGDGGAGRLEGGEVNFEAGKAGVEGGWEERRLAARQNDDFAFGDWYVTAITSAIPKLTPYLPGDTSGTYVQGQVLEMLASRDWDEPDQWRPVLAESWEVSEDGLTVAFNLRKNVKFANGEPFTSEDVVFTYEWVMSPEIAAPRMKSYWERIESVTADGPHRVVFKLKDTYFLGFSICAQVQVLSKQYYSQFTAQEFNSLPGLLYGSGPYKLREDPKEWRSSTEPTVLVRNENYWGVQPALDRLVFKIFTSRGPMVTAFRNREFDHIVVYPDEYLNFREDQNLRQGRRWLEFQPVNTGYRYVGWNCAKPMFADKRVRQALTMLIDREQMARREMNGTVAVANGPFSPLGKQADPSIEPWPYDPERAMKQLAEAGWEDRDGNGVLENEQGVEFVFELTIPASVKSYEIMAEAIRESMKRGKVSVKINKQEWNSMLEKMDKRDFDAISLGWGAGGPESDVFQMFHSSNIADGGDNNGGYRSDRVDEAIWQARFELDPEKRYALWREVHRILHDEQPYTFMFVSRQVRLVDQRLHNANPTKLGFVHWDEWYVPIGQQVPRQ